MATSLHQNNQPSQGKPSRSNIPLGSGGAGLRTRVSPNLRSPCTLSSGELKELHQYEDLVSKGWTTFVDVGRALAKIRDKRLYRGEYETFEAYCVKKWQYRRAHAYRLIGAAQVVDVLSPIGDIPKPANESVLRPLLGLQPEKAIEAWKKAAQKAGNRSLTAKLVEEAVQELGVSTSTMPKTKAKRPLKGVAALLKLIESGEAFLEQNQITKAKEVLVQVKQLLKKQG